MNLSGFSKLPMLIGPRFKRLIGERGDRERLAALKHQRSKRIHPKRHSVNRERSFQNGKRLRSTPNISPTMQRRGPHTSDLYGLTGSANATATPTLHLSPKPRGQP